MNPHGGDVFSFGVQRSPPLFSFFAFLLECGGRRRFGLSLKANRAKERKKRRRPPHSCALERNEPARCKSLPGSVWDPVTEGNCVLARGGGEQPQVNLPSAAQANSIRPAVLASLRVKGEAPRTLLSQAGMSPGLRRVLDSYYLHDAVVRGVGQQGDKFLIVLQQDDCFASTPPVQRSRIRQNAGTPRPHSPECGDTTPAFWRMRGHHARILANAGTPRPHSGECGYEQGATNL